MSRARKIKLLKLALIAVCLLPLVGLFVQFATDPPADPYKAAAHVTGETALRLLVLTLAITPIRLITGYSRLGVFRRNLGVLAFSYAVCHIFSYMWLEASFSFSYLIEDIADRRYITAGFAAFLMMVPLAATSTNVCVCKLGATWQKLHRLMYPLCIAACVHFLWLKRGDDIGEPLVYLGLVLLLLAVRLGYRLRKHPARTCAPATVGRNETGRVGQAG